jgi:cysteinyl-tRNA synthetase
MGRRITILTGTGFWRCESFRAGTQPSVTTKDDKPLNSTYIRLDFSFLLFWRHMQRTMSLAQALQWKAKMIVPQMQQLWTIVQGSNSVEKPTEREDDVLASFEQALKVSEYMVVLEKILDKASMPSRALAKEKKELVDRMTQIQRIPTRHGQQREASWMAEKPALVDYDAILRKAMLDPIIDTLRRRLARLQVEIDEQNTITRVELDVPDYVEQPVV